MDDKLKTSEFIAPDNISTQTGEKKEDIKHYSKPDDFDMSETSRDDEECHFIKQYYERI